MFGLGILEIVVLALLVLLPIAVVGVLMLVRGGPKRERDED